MAGLHGIYYQQLRPVEQTSMILTTFKKLPYILTEIYMRPGSARYFVTEEACSNQLTEELRGQE
jgi:hypothetical protein